MFERFHKFYVYSKVKSLKTNFPNAAENLHYLLKYYCVYVGIRTIRNYISLESWVIIKTLNAFEHDAARLSKT